MINTDIFVQVARMGLEGDKNSLIDYLENLAADSSNKNKHKLSKELKHVIDEYHSASTFTVSSFDGSPSNDKPMQSTLNIWLSDTIRKKIGRFIAVHQDKSLPDDLKRAYGRLLLYGPPGSGKTTIGYYIAEKLDIPISYIKVSDVISSKFGETTRNIAEIFEQPGKRLIFLDEFDAFGKSRYDNNDVGELKRIVNSLIQTLDFSAKDKIVIGATNIIESIDPAIVRRFNLQIKVDKLDSQESLEFLNFTLENSAAIPAKISSKDRKGVVSAFNALGIQTIDAIKNVVEHTIINSHLANKKALDIDDIYATLLTSGYIEKNALKSISKSNKDVYGSIMNSLSEQFNNVDISGYVGIHRNSINNYNRRNVK